MRAGLIIGICLKSGCICQWMYSLTPLPLGAPLLPYYQPFVPPKHTQIKAYCIHFRLFGPEPFFLFCVLWPTTR